MSNKIEKLDRKEFLNKLKTNSFPKRRFSKEEQALMRSVNLASFLYWYDPNQIIREGSSYRLTENRSVVLYKGIARDFAYPTSNKPGEKNPCTGIDFCVQYLGLSVSQAMYALWAFINRPNPNALPVLSSISTELLKERIKCGTYKKAIGIPAIYGYLAGTRKINPKVIVRLQREDLLYAEPLEKGHNLLFAMLNADETLCGFEVCGVLSHSQNRYKGSIVAVPYSCFNLAVTYRPTNPASLLLVFESAIDLISFLSLLEDGKIRLPENMNVLALSLRGLTYRIIEDFIDDNSFSNICYIGLCIDNDKAGQAFCEEAEKKAREATPVDLTVILTSEGVKDWNELLKKGVDKPIDLNSYLPQPVTQELDIDEEDLPF